MIRTEKASYDHIANSLNEPEKQKQLNLQDEEEDFLDECEYSESEVVYAIVNICISPLSKCQHPRQRLPTCTQARCCSRSPRNNSILA
jgi:hypothetical protein